MKTKELVVLTKKLLLSQFFIWIIFGLLRIVFLFDSFQSQTVQQIIILVMMIGNGFMFLVLAWGIGKWKKLFSVLSFFYLLLNFVLTLTDQFGLLDLMVLILNFVSLGFLLLLIKNSFFITSS